jgi:hypothetical protein
MSEKPSYTERAAVSQRLAGATEAAFTGRYDSDQVHFASEKTKKVAEQARELERKDVADLLGAEPEQLEMGWMKDEQGTDVVPKGVFNIKGSTDSYKIEYDKSSQRVILMKQSKAGGAWKKENSRSVDKKEWSLKEKLLRAHSPEDNVAAMRGGAP